MGFPLKDLSGHPIWPGSLPIWSKAVSFEAIPIRVVNQEGQPTGYYWAHTLFSTSDLLNWTNPNPTYRENPQRMADLIASIFVTHHPNWADVQALLNILLTADERWLVINKANEEAQCFHQENPNGNPNLAGAIPLTKPD